MSRFVKSLGDRVLARMLPEASAAAAGCGGGSWSNYQCSLRTEWEQDCTVAANCAVHCSAWYANGFNC